MRAMFGMRTAPNGVSALPQDVLTHVLQFVDVRTLVHAEHACRALAMAARSPSVLVHLVPEDDESFQVGHQHPTSILSLWEARGRKAYVLRDDAAVVVEFRFSGVRHVSVDCASWPTDVLQRCFRRWRRLESLTISNMSATDCSELVQWRYMVFIPLLFLLSRPKPLSVAVATTCSPCGPWTSRASPRGLGGRTASTRPSRCCSLACRQTASPRCA